MATTYPVTFTPLNLRDSTNWEPNETSRIPLARICEPGQNPWEAAFAYQKSLGSSQPFKIDYMLDTENRIVGYMRIFRNPEECSVNPGRDEMDEELYQLERIVL